MQSITDLQKVLQPVFERYYTKKVYMTSADNSNLNFYVVGCTRAGLVSLQKEITSVLHCPEAVALNHVEADMMIDSTIRNDGILIYDAGSGCLH